MGALCAPSVDRNEEATGQEVVKQINDDEQVYVKCWEPRGDTGLEPASAATPRKDLVVVMPDAKAKVAEAKEKPYLGKSNVLEVPAMAREMQAVPELTRVKERVSTRGTKPEQEKSCRKECCMFDGLISALPGSGGPQQRKVTLPENGRKYNFLIKGMGSMSKTFMVHDASTSPPTPWLTLKQQSDLKLNGGTILLLGGENEKTLASVEVAPNKFSHVNVADKANYPWWGGAGGGAVGISLSAVSTSLRDVKTAWEVKRSMTESTIGLSIVGTFAGVAKADDTNAFDSLGLMDTQCWSDADAKCVYMDVKVSLGRNKSVPVVHNFGKDMKDRPKVVVFSIEAIGLKASYKGGWMADDYDVEIDETAENPMHSLLVAFLLLRFLHPGRAEERAVANDV